MLKKANIQMSGKQLATSVKNGKILFDCAQQRGYVWDNERNSTLIHSMAQCFPIPPFYFAKRSDGKYDALDGKQRSNAISTYINGEYALSTSTMPFFDDEGNEFDFGGKRFSELPEWTQDAIKDYSLTIYYFEGITDEEISEMFFRLNYGKPLTAIELTRVKAKSICAFQRIAEHDLIATCISEKGKAKYNDEDVAMKAWAFCYDDKPDFSTKTFRPFIETAEVTEEQESMLINTMDYVLPIIESMDAENKEQKKILRKLKAKNNLISCIYLAKMCIENGVDAEQFSNIVTDFFTAARTTKSEEYNDTVGAGSGRADSIEKRISALNQILNANNN